MLSFLREDHSYYDDDHGDYDESNGRSEYSSSSSSACFLFVQRCPGGLHDSMARARDGRDGVYAVILHVLEAAAISDFVAADCCQASEVCAAGVRNNWMISVQAPLWALQCPFRRME